MPLYGPVKDQLMARYGRICQYCGAPATTLDHIVPVAWGGDDTFANQVAACWPCNEIASGDLFCDFQQKKEWIAGARASRYWVPRGGSRVDRRDGRCL
jgi:5-methylcytosine-specific restriction endonuclease McrA